MGKPCGVAVELPTFIMQKKTDSKSRKIPVVSLFSGCGGMDLGFVLKGFQVRWANDIDSSACKTYELNFGKHIYQGDISKFDLSRLPACEVILGGFPCQDFSMIWKRQGIETKRGNLYRYFVDAVTLKKPKVFLAENVKGLMTANKGRAIKQIIKDFQSVGYTIKTKLVNFANYGTPQIRERVLIIGIRDDLDHKAFIFPKPSHSLNNYVSSKKALKNVERVLHNNEHQKLAHKTIERLKLIPPGGNFTNVPKNSPYYVKGMISHVYRRLHPDKPSTTIIASGGGGTWGYHYKHPRSLTNRERARLFGYPDDFIFKGSISDVRRQIGNSVPPIGIQPFAEAIYKFLN